MKWFFGFLNLVVGLGLIMIATGPVKAVEFYSLLEGDSSGKELSYGKLVFADDSYLVAQQEDEGQDSDHETSWDDYYLDTQQGLNTQQDGTGQDSGQETPRLDLPSDFDRAGEQMEEAYGSQETIFGGTGGTGGGGAGDFSGLVDLIISRVLNPIVIFLFAVGVVIFLWGMIKYLGKMDNDDERKKWLNLMVYGLIIMFVMFSVWGLVNILLDTVFPTGVGSRPPIPQFQ